MPATPTGAHDPGGPQLGRARRARQPRRGVPVEGSAGPLRRWPLCHGRLEQNGKERKKERGSGYRALAFVCFVGEVREGEITYCLPYFLLYGQWLVFVRFKLIPCHHL